MKLEGHTYHDLDREILVLQRAEHFRETPHQCVPNASMHDLYFPSPLCGIFATSVLRTAFKGFVLLPTQAKELPLAARNEEWMLIVVPL